MSGSLEESKVHESRVLLIIYLKAQNSVRHIVDIQ